MKKTFLNATLFSLLLGTVPVATLTGCKDYDSDIDGLTQRDDELQKEINDKLAQQSEALGNQVSVLQAALETLKKDADTASKNAAAAAAAAQQTADQAVSAASSANAEALKAQSAAEAANAEAQAAQAAAAAAQAAAVEETIKQVEALRTQIDGQIKALENKYGQEYATLSAAVAKAATTDDLNAAVSKLEAAISASRLTQSEVEEMLKTYIAQINSNTKAIEALSGRIDGINVRIDGLSTSIDGVNSSIGGINTSIDGINASITGINGDINTLKTDLGGKIAANEASIAKNAADIAANTQGISKNEAEISKNALAINTEAQRINKIVDETIPGLQQTLEAADAQLSADLAAHTSAYNTFKTEVTSQIQALETFKSTYENLLSKLSGIDFDDMESRIAAAESSLTSALQSIATNTSNIGVINGQITTIKGDITDIKGDINDINGDISGINGQITTITGQITDANGEIATIKANITTINGLITALQTKDTEHDSAISAIQTALGTAQSDIVKINAALSTLNSLGAKRLTSVTLVPTSYVGGIPTIEFYSASFTPLGAKGTDGVYAPAANGAAAKLITNNDTQVYYRLNPSGVTIDDIDKDNVTFVQMIASSRAAETPVISVVNVDKDPETGFLVVTATKAEGVTGSIDNAGVGKIYTAALKVPVAAKNYYKWTDSQGNTVTEDAADAVVYSEYCRISESSFVPEIAQAEVTPINHFSNTTIWTATNIDPVEEVSYVTEGFDLSELVTGCMNDNGDHTLMTAAQLESFGFTFEFSVPDKPYNVAGVNQQLYASVTSAGILTSKYPTGSTVASCVDKTPIISVVMKYGDDVVDQKFFKVKFIIDAEDATKSIDMFSQELTCDDIDASISWEKFSEIVLAQPPFQMTKEEFLANYTVDLTEASGVTVDPEDADNYISWTVEPWEIGDMKGADVTMKRTITYKSTLFPDITVNLNGTVEWPSSLPQLGKVDAAIWNNNVMEILPDGMPNPYVDGETATYNSNVLSGRIAPYLTNLLPCSTWDVKILSVPEGFTIGDDDKYQINQGEMTGATLWYNDDHTAWFEKADADEETTLKKMNFFIDPNDAGIALVEAQATINLGWYINLNGVVEHDGESFVNEVVLENTVVKIIKPLVSLGRVEDVEPLTQKAEAQYRDLADGLQITDCYGNKFVDGSDYWKFYGITEITWSNDIYLTDEDGSNERSLESLNYTSMVDENGKLTFTGSGIKLQQPIVLNVPVTVTHKWGKLKSTVQVIIKNANLQ